MPSVRFLCGKYYWVAISVFVIAVSFFGYARWLRQQQRAHAPAPAPLVSASPAAPSPIPSHDTQVLRIAFSRKNGIHAIAPDGKHEHVVFAEDLFEILEFRGFPFAISPDGQWILFQRGFSVEPDNPLALLNLADKKSTDLSLKIMGHNFAFTPDSRQVAYTRYSNETVGGPVVAGIYLCDVQGESPIRLFTQEGHEWIDGLSFSPDGNALVATTITNAGDPKKERYDVWLITVSNGAGKPLTKLGDARWPSFAPDGKTIVFSRDTGLYTIGTDGTNLHRLTDLEKDIGAEEHGHPSYSPDGAMIAFHRTWKTGKRIQYEEDEFDEINATVCVMRADGTEVQRLVQGWYPCWMHAQE